MLKLDSGLKADLLAQPESGMGYQIVEATDFNGRIQRGVAYNAELLLFDEEQRRMFRTASFARLLNEANISAQIRSVRVVAHTASTASAFALRETATRSARKPPPAKDAPLERTKEKDVFKRFTAYENDHRVKPDGSLLPGTYATTEDDAKNVQTGKEAVARYALPNPNPASNKWTIEPHKDTLIQRGMVEPANDQPGGGVEVIFTVGTQPGTVTGPEKIPAE